MLSQATRDREKGKRDGPTCGDDFMWLCIVESRNPATHPNSLIWIWPLQMNPMDAFPNHGNQYLVEPQNNTVKLTYAMPPKRGTPTTTSGVVFWGLGRLVSSTHSMLFFILVPNHECWREGLWGGHCVQCPNQICQPNLHLCGETEVEGAGKDLSQGSTASTPSLVGSVTGGRLFWTSLMEVTKEETANINDWNLKIRA